MNRCAEAPEGCSGKDSNAVSICRTTRSGLFNPKPIVMNEQGIKGPSLRVLGFVTKNHGRQHRRRHRVNGRRYLARAQHSRGTPACATEEAEGGQGTDLRLGYRLVSA